MVYVLYLCSSAETVWLDLTYRSTKGSSVGGCDHCEQFSKQMDKLLVSCLQNQFCIGFQHRRLDTGVLGPRGVPFGLGTIGKGIMFLLCWISYPKSDVLSKELQSVID